MIEPVLRALVLTEDSARDADETIRALLWKMLQRIVAVKPDRRRIEFTPVGAEVRAASKGTNWKSRRRQKRVSLIREIARVLAAGEFVFFHIDGDRRWRHRKSSENVRLLFQNERVGLALAARHGTVADVEQISAWAADRTLLDEVERPKEALSFGAKFNAAFVERYPMPAVIDAERSLAAVVWALAEDEALVSALKATAP